MKQTIEIEVPEGKKAIWEDNKVKFVPINDWRTITNFPRALEHVKRNIPECSGLIDSFYKAPVDSYELKVATYRIVVAALTNNEKRHLTAGERWHPVVQFCRPEDKENCYGNTVVGTIESEGRRYLVVGGGAEGNTSAGLSYFDLLRGVSLSWADVGFKSVSSKEVAEHISKYFGRLLFEVHYGGTNCDWKWVD